MQIDKNLNSQARKRLELLFDDGEYTEIGSFTKEKDNLTGVVTAFGYVNGNAVYAFSQDVSVENGAVGKAQAKKIANIYNLAAKTGNPVVGIHDSNGAFVENGAAALEAYGEMLNAASVVSGVVPQISIILGTCVGCGALLAMSADFVVVSEKSEISMTTLSDSAEAEKIASAVCKDDAESIKKARDIINLIPINNLSGAPAFNYDDPSDAFNGDFSTISAICDAESVVELSEKTGKASYTALASIGGTSVGIVATNKTNDKLTSEDASKIARFVRTCDAFSLPIITFVDTEGFEKDGADSIKALVKVAGSYSEATTAKISIVSGKAVGSTFVALAGKSVNSDFTFAYENATIAPMEPLAAVEFLWHDKLSGATDLTAKRNELADEYVKTVANAENAAYEGAVDEIIEPSETRKVLISSLEILAGKRVQKLPKKHNNILL
jgi:acetyl-CoA carboxylase carboxyltransferase component